LRHLTELRQYHPEDLHPFVDTLDKINSVYSISHAKNVATNHRDLIGEFEATWRLLMKDFNITMPLKVHIICHHLSDFFEMKGTTLRKVSDQVVEAAHHKVKHFFESHPNYNHKEKESLEAGEAALAAIIHFNSNNLSSK
jgi:hypothetical protein